MNDAATTNSDRKLDADAIIIGGGPAGAALATMCAQGGHRALLLEKDIHPPTKSGDP